MDNSAERGGGVYFEDNTKVLIKKYYAEQLLPEVVMKFAGGMQHLEEQYMSRTTPTMERVYITATECFIQVQALYTRTAYPNCNLGTDVSQENINTINVYFSDNKATRNGDDIFGGLLHGCITDILLRVVMMIQLALIV